VKFSREGTSVVNGVTGRLLITFAEISVEAAATEAGALVAATRRIAAAERACEKLSKM
jgi:hypothetical protein